MKGEKGKEEEYERKKAIEEGDDADADADADDDKHTKVLQTKNIYEENIEIEFQIFCT